MINELRNMSLPQQSSRRVIEHVHETCDSNSSCSQRCLRRVRRSPKYPSMDSSTGELQSPNLSSPSRLSYNAKRAEQQRPGQPKPLPKSAVDSAIQLPLSAWDETPGPKAPAEASRPIPITKPSVTFSATDMSTSPPPPPPPPPAPQDLVTAILGIRSTDLVPKPPVSGIPIPPDPHVLQRTDDNKGGIEQLDEKPPPPPPPPAQSDLATAILGLRTLDLDTSQPKVSRHVSSKKTPPREPIRDELIVNPSIGRTNQHNRLVLLIQETMSDQEILMRKRLNAVSRRNGLRSQWALYQSAQQTFKEVFEQILPTLGATSGVDTARHVQLAHTWQKSEKLLRTIAKLQELEVDEEEILLDMERTCITHETEVSRHLRDFVPHALHHDESNLSETVSDTHDSVSSKSLFDGSSSSASRATIVQRYLRTIGHVNLLRDRMFNLTSELRLQEYRRSVNMESGRPPKVSESAFYGGFEKRRQDIIREYQATKDEMTETYQACVEAGEDVQEPGLSPEVDQIFSEWNDHNMPITGKDDPHRLSRSENNIARWAEEVQRLSQTGSGHVVHFSGLDQDIQEEPASPRYHSSRDSGRSTASDHAIVSTTAAPSDRQPMSFVGDIPTNRRRYSAPMLFVPGAHGKDTPALDFQDAKARRTNRRRKEHRWGLHRAKSNA